MAANITTYTDVITDTIEAQYFYQVIAVNKVGYSGVPGYSTLTVTSTSGLAQVSVPAPAAPTDLTAVLRPDRRSC